MIKVSGVELQLHNFSWLPASSLITDLCLVTAYILIDLHILTLYSYISTYAYSVYSYRSTYAYSCLFLQIHWPFYPPFLILSSTWECTKCACFMQMYLYDYRIQLTPQNTKPSQVLQKSDIINLTNIAYPNTNMAKEASRSVSIVTSGRGGRREQCLLKPPQAHRGIYTEKMRVTNTMMRGATCHNAPTNRFAVQSKTAMWVLLGWG